MPETFDTDSITPEYLEYYYRTARGKPWQSEAEEYERDPGSRFRLRLLLDELELLRPRRLLDVGCGGAVLASIAAEHFDFEIFACDLAIPDGIASEIKFTAADAARLPFADNSFDAVVCSEVLEHLYDPGAGARELARVLAPGGATLITVPNLFALDSIDGSTGIISNIARLLSKIDKRWEYGHTTHITRRAPGWWRNLLADCGFALIDDRPVYIFPYIPYFLKLLKKREADFFTNAGILERWMKIETRLVTVPPVSHLGQFHFFHCRKK